MQTLAASAPIDKNHDMNTTEKPAAPSPIRLSQTLLVVWSVLSSAAAAVFLVAAIFFATASTRNAPPWEYWIQYGDPKAFIEGTAERLEKGWEVVTLSVSGSKFEAVGVVVLRRPKP